MRAALSLSLHPTWQIWPFWFIDWFPMGYHYCAECGDDYYARRALNLTLYLPFVAVHIATPAWFTTRPHAHQERP